eukprot:SAG22_NODE_82_length_21749_cov_10.719769_6_plen_692_part_00
MRSTEFRGAGLAGTATLGARVRSGAHLNGLSGTLAMVQIYSDALGLDRAQCIHQGGQRLVESGRMALLADTGCRAAVSTGCTDVAASNGPPMRTEEAGSTPARTNDDGSCIFAHSRSAATESGVAHVTDDWATIVLRNAYTRPLVYCGTLTRSSTAQAVVRIGSLHADLSGSWSFQIYAQQKLCHLATPPPLNERVSYLVVEAGTAAAAAEGWQAGVVRVVDQEWHRASFHEPFESAPPVVLTQVQNHEERTKLVTVRQQLFPAPSAADRSSPHFSVFVQVEGEGVWCPDGQFYAEYYGSLDLSGSPVATGCEPDAPDWHWHSCCGGSPPAMGSAGTALFAARWSSRFHSQGEAAITFRSYASSGSRVIVDEVIVLDVWHESGSTYSSEPVTVGPGYHYLGYEYQSAGAADAAPTNSFATLSWTGLSNATALGSDVPVFADVGWLAVANGTGSMHGIVHMAGYLVPLQSHLAVDVAFATSFDSAPLMFAGYQSGIHDVAKGGHLRLVESHEATATVAIEFDTCGVAAEGTERLVAWVALSTAAGTHEDTRVHQMPTLQSDVTALLLMSAELKLPGYLRWRNGSDPCRDRWAGIECRSDGSGQSPRVVVLDIHNVDLTGRDLPWDAIGALLMLEELSLWNCALSGAISAAALCALTSLRVLVMSQNMIRGTLPECLPQLHLTWMWLEENRIQ